MTTTPSMRELSREESRTLLAKKNVGRIAFTLHDRVDLEPISYVNDGDWIFGRTSAGSKLTKLLHHPWCAFEVDEVHGLFDWTSVVVKGTFQLLDPETGSPDIYRRATKLLRKLVPGTLSAQDPAPHRDVVFGIYVNEVTGRTSTARARKQAHPRHARASASATGATTPSVAVRPPGLESAT